MQAEEIPQKEGFLSTEGAGQVRCPAPVCTGFRKTLSPDREVPLAGHSQTEIAVPVDGQGTQTAARTEVAEEMVWTSPPASHYRW